MKSKIFILFLTLNLLNFEVYSMDSKEELNNSFSQDGLISESQAINIVQNDILKNGRHLYNSKKARLINSKDSHYDAIPKELFNSYWIIIIPTSFKIRFFQGLEWGIFNVDKKTGEIKGGGMGPA